MSNAGSGDNDLAGVAIHRDERNEFFLHQHVSIIPMSRINDVFSVLVTLFIRGYIRLRFNENQRFRVGTIDSFTETVVENPVIITGEIYWFAFKMSEIIRAQQMGCSRCIEVPHAMLLPDAVETGQPCSLAGFIHTT